MAAIIANAMPVAKICITAATRVQLWLKVQVRATATTAATTTTTIAAI